MQALFLVLNKVELLEDILHNLVQAGVKGGTIIESTGMARALGNDEDSLIFGSLRMLLNPQRAESKTLFFILKEEQVPVVRKVIDQTVGGINKPDTGIIFGFALSFMDGVGEQ